MELFLIFKLERDAIDAMSLVSRCRESFILEDVPEMATTVGAGDLDSSHTVRGILVSLDSA
jgi:hypothetical protein